MTLIAQRKLPEHRKPVMSILGPTASGKTEWSDELSPVTIIGCDSVHFYRELCIGSSRPSDERLAEVPHACVAEISISEQVDAALYVERARLATESASFPVCIVGGSPFYFQAVALGLAPTFVSPTPLRQDLERAYDASPDELYEELLKRDPALKTKIHLHDRYRMIRALEVMRVTQEPWSLWQKRREAYLPWLEGTHFVLLWEYADLRERIQKRTALMLEDGWLEEVRSLLKTFPPDSPGFRVVGYRNIVEFLNRSVHPTSTPLQSKCETLEELAIQISAETWQMARKQMTYFRSLSQKMNLIGIDGRWALSNEGKSALRNAWNFRADSVPSDSALTAVKHF